MTDQPVPTPEQERVALNWLVSQGLADAAGSEVLTQALARLLAEREAAVRLEQHRWTAEALMRAGCHAPGCPAVYDDESDAALDDYQACVCEAVAILEGPPPGGMK